MRSPRVMMAGAEIPSYSPVNISRRFGKFAVMSAGSRCSSTPTGAQSSKPTTPAWCEISIHGTISNDADRPVQRIKPFAVRCSVMSAEQCRITLIEEDEWWVATDETVGEYG